MIDKKVLDKLEYSRILDSITKYCYTENGKNIITGLQPFDEISEAEYEGNLVSEAKNILIEEGNPPLEYLPDLYESLAKSNIEGTILDPKSIIDIANLAEVSRRIFNFLSRYESSKLLHQDFLEKLFVDRNFEKHLREIFTESGEIQDNASKTLRDLRRSINDKSQSLQRVINKILKQLSDAYLVREEYMTLREGRIVLPIKSEHKRHVKGFIHSESATGQTVYIEPEETLELNNEILSLKFAEKREIDRILKSITKRIGDSSRELKISLQSINKIDAIFAKAHFSIEIIGSFPSFDINQSFNLIEGYHPLLLKKLGKQKTVPLSFEIKNNKIILITGPNAGGKTVVLKNVGLLVALALTGIHIPVHPDTNFHPFDNLLLDIGDEQSIEDDLSTFSSHLSNIQKILKKADGKSLVLLDEIGTGTDPSEGSALATAVLIELSKKGSTVFATTHHGNLKIVANEMDGFQNASMAFDLETLTPTYKFNQGIPGSSYAFEVAKRIGYTDDFISSANSYLDKKKSKIEELLIDLEKKSQNLQNKLNQSEIENSRLKGLTNVYEKKINELELSKSKILSETKIKADEYLKDINKTVESVIKNIKESNAAKDTVKQERQRIEDLKQTRKEKFVDKKIKNASEPLTAETGMYVKLKNTSTTGRIESIDHNKKTAIVIAGTLKLHVKLSELENSSQSQIKSTATDSSRNFTFISDVKSARLDIRGKKPEEAEFEIIKFIDDSYASNMSQIEILHGKGTGVLKQTVRDICKKNDVIKNYYFAKIEFGGEGITVIDLK